MPHDTMVKIEADERSQRRERIRRAVLSAAKERCQNMKQEQLTLKIDWLAPISPTPLEHISLVLSHLKNLDATSLLLDIGCGDGRWLIRATQETNCKCVGCDLNTDRLELAREQVQLHGLSDRIQLLHQDALEFLQNSPLVLDSTVIVIYLFREAMQKVSDILRQRLLPSRDTTSCEPKPVQIVSIGFSLPRFTPVWHHSLGALHIYMYNTSVESKTMEANSKT